MLPAAGSRGRLSEPTERRVRLVSAAARPSAPPAVHATDSYPASSPSGSAHVITTVYYQTEVHDQTTGAEFDGDDQRVSVEPQTDMNVNETKYRQWNTTDVKQ